MWMAFKELKFSVCASFSLSPEAENILMQVFRVGTLSNRTSEQARRLIWIGQNVDGFQGAEVSPEIKNRTFSCSLSCRNLIQSNIWAREKGAPDPVLTPRNLHGGLRLRTLIWIRQKYLDDLCVSPKPMAIGLFLRGILARRPVPAPTQIHGVCAFTVPVSKQFSSRLVSRDFRM